MCVSVSERALAWASKANSCSVKWAARIRSSSATAVPGGTGKSTLADISKETTRSREGRGLRPSRTSSRASYWRWYKPSPVITAKRARRVRSSDERRISSARCSERRRCSLAASMAFSEATYPPNAATMATSTAKVYQRWRVKVEVARVMGVIKV